MNKIFLKKSLLKKLLKIENCRSDKNLKYQQISDHFQRPQLKKEENFRNN